MSVFIFSICCQTVFYTSWKFYTHTSSCTASLKILDIDYSFSFLKKFSHSGYLDIFIVLWICIVSIAIWVSVFVKWAVQHAIFKTLILYIFFAYKSLIYSLDKTSFLKEYITNIYAVSCLFTFVMLWSDEQKFWIPIKSNLPIFLLWILLKKFLLVTMHGGFFSYFV